MTMSCLHIVKLCLGKMKLKENELWKIANKDESQGNKILSIKCVFRVKEDGTYKASLVVRVCQ